MPKSTLISALKKKLRREYNHLGWSICAALGLAITGFFAPELSTPRCLAGEVRTGDEIRTKALLAAMDAADAEAVILPASAVPDEE